VDGKSWIAIGLAVFLFVAAFLVLYQQSITFGQWFQIKDVIHHEIDRTGFIIGREK
jgi:hypothetical protein